VAERSNPKNTFFAASMKTEVYEIKNHTPSLRAKRSNPKNKIIKNSKSNKIYKTL
jgi:hypothetical protein